MRYTITGATGHLGTEVLKVATEKLSIEELRISIRTIKKAEKYKQMGVEVKKADYSNKAELVLAWQDTDVLVYIPSIVHPSYERLPEIENVVLAAEEAKVKHVIFVSFYADQENNPFQMSPFYGYATRRLACSSLSYTILKNAMYADPLINYLPELIERGNVVYPVPHEKVSFISREDSAKAIVEVAADASLQNKTYTLTQNRSYTMRELADTLSKVSGEKIGFSPMSLKKFAQTYDEPKGFGGLLVSMYEAANCGLMDIVTEDYRTIMGREAESLSSYLKRHYPTN
ncbi:NmrA family NAD(P)-binding protein [Carnobacterium funditum]|uniref:NmrA family NAD(P)-binding protein n=1 Tax=Carnobacterium funditum TaxID=2752 RepID=UPI0005569E04|nr:NAD(P)H-binding protein [Carnobacterium funditum]